MAEKHTREEIDVVISFFGAEIENVICPYEDNLVITVEIDGYDAKLCKTFNYIMQ